MDRREHINNLVEAKIDYKNKYISANNHLEFIVMEILRLERELENEINKLLKKRGIEIN